MSNVDTYVELATDLFHIIRLVLKLADIINIRSISLREEATRQAISSDKS